MKIAIAGLGYVGLSNAILLAQHNEVVAIDIDPEKVTKLNIRQSPIEDAEVQDYLANRPLNLRATQDKQEAYQGADYVVIATPTDYDPVTNYFNTQSIESVIQDLRTANPQAVMGIQFTVPLGDKANRRPNLHFFPECLREGHAPYDKPHLARIVVGDRSERPKIYAASLSQGPIKRRIDVLANNCTEANLIVVSLLTSDIDNQANNIYSPKTSGQLKC